MLALPPGYSTFTLTLNIGGLEEVGAFVWVEAVEQVTGKVDDCIGGSLALGAGRP
jgi:hypothetical protein